LRQKFHLWVEDYLFCPNLFQKVISFLLLPLTFIYILIIAFKRANAKQINFQIPIISIGNIIVGGSGKTPLIIELAKKYENVAVVLRGYKRQSKGLIVVSNRGKIQVDVKKSGDEAMLLSLSLNKATVIVGEDRKKAILKAKELACKIVFLDDGFSKYDIFKFDILIKPKDEPGNIFCLPSGGYREPKKNYSLANMRLKENLDFKRLIFFSKEGKSVDTLPSKLVLLTAISRPKRLLEFLPKNTQMVSFEDHHNFTEDEINKIKKNFNDFSIITTSKDYVKLKGFRIKNLYLINLSLKIKSNLKPIDEFINQYKID